MSTLNRTVEVLKEGFDAPRCDTILTLNRTVEVLKARVARNGLDEGVALNRTVEVSGAHSKMWPGLSRLDHTLVVESPHLHDALDPMWSDAE